MIPRTSSDQANRLALSSNLLKYLAERGNLESFTLHDWLQTIDDSELHQVEQIAYWIVHPARHPTASAPGKDIAGLVIIAVGAEACRKISREKAIKNLYIFITRLMLSACAERLRRAGWVHIAEPLSLTSERPPAVTFTATGLIETARSNNVIVNSLLKISSALQ